MSQNPYKPFVRRYLTRGAVAVSVGLAPIAPASASVQTAATDFASKLSMIRAAVSECEQEFKTAQVIPRPLPPRPFPNWENAAPFENFGKTAPFTNFGKAPFSDFSKKGQ